MVYEYNLVFVQRTRLCYMKLKWGNKREQTIAYGWIYGIIYIILKWERYAQAKPWQKRIITDLLTYLICLNNNNVNILYIFHSFHNPMANLIRIFMVYCKITFVHICICMHTINKCKIRTFKFQTKFQKSMQTNKNKTVKLCIA